MKSLRIFRKLLTMALRGLPWRCSGPTYGFDMEKRPRTTASPLVEVRLCEARSWPVDCRHVQEQLASIVPVKLGLRVHGVRDDAPLICRLVSASGCTQPGVRLGFLVAGGTDLCVEDGLPALL